MSRDPRTLAVLALILSLAVLPASVAARDLDPGDDLRPARGPVVPGRYIVVLQDGVPNAAAVASELAVRHGISVSHVYEFALKGFAGEVPEDRLNALRRDPRVAFVEPDQTVQLFDQTLPTGIRRVFADENPNIDIDGTDDLRVDVDVAVIDTGIDLDHADLNVVASVNCSGGSPFRGSCGSGGDDDNGHGTHVAGSIAAIDNGIGVVGVAPGARLWAVKVLRANGSGYISWIVAGIDYVTANADKIEVANMSLGCECSSDSLDKAISNSVAAGVVYAVAAGNSDKDATTFSPANHPDVITVSALADFDGEPGALGSPTCRTDEDDTLANFSNFGSLIEVAAPGVCILSTWNDGGYNTISGTSMASPHAAGAAALLASGANDPTSKADVDAIRQTIIDTGNFNWTDDSGDGIQEPLLDVSNTTVYNPAKVAGSSPPADNPPSVSITSPTDGATVAGTISVSADATDDKGVSQVEFFVDGASIGIGVDGDGSNGWSVSWDTTIVADGGHTVGATATDTAGQTASHEITVKVDNVDDPPSVAITSPSDGATVSGTISVQATASDDRGVSQVEFFIDGVSLGVDTAAPYEVAWDTTTVADESHQVKAMATDSGGQTASHTITVNVNNSADPNAMGVFAIDWSPSKHLDVTVYIRRDSDSSGGTLTGADTPAASASVTFVLTHDTNGNDLWEECGGADNCWTFSGSTNGDGYFRGKLLHAPSGKYRAEVTGLTHSTYTWSKALDVDNPDTFTK